MWHDPFGRAATRSAQLVAVLVATAAVVWLLVQLRLVVVPAVLAAIVASAAWPLVRWLRARGASDLLAGVGALLAGGLVLAALGWVVVRGIYGQWDDLLRNAGSGLRELERSLASVLPLDLDEIRELRGNVVRDASDIEVQQEAVSGAVLAGELLAGLALFVVVLFFLLKDGPMIARFMRDRFPDAERERVERIGKQSVELLGGYARGTAFVAAVDAVLIGAALALLGVPLAVPLGVVVFLGGFVPIAGATTAGALAALIALVTNGPVTALAVVGIVLAVNQLEGNVLAPVILGNALSMHPVVILLALAAGAITAGIIGAILAVPVVALGWAVASSWNAQPT